MELMSQRILSDNPVLMKAHSVALEPKGKTQGPKQRIISRFSTRIRKDRAKVEHKQESYLHPMD